MIRWQAAWTLGATMAISAAACGGGAGSGGTAGAGHGGTSAAGRGGANGGAGGVSGASGRGGAGGSSADASAGGSSGSGAAGSSGGLDVSVDQTSLTIELGTTTRLAITLTASNGFSGTVMLASALNPSSAPPTGWTLTLDAASVAVPLNGTAMTHATLTLPTENRGLTATARFTATSATSGTSTATTAISVLNQYTFSVPVVNGGCVYPTGTVNITTGSKIRWVNTSTGPSLFTIHSNGTAYGCAIQDPSMPSHPGDVYECTILNGTADGQSFSWYCHSPGPDLGALDPFILPVPPVN